VKVPQDSDTESNKDLNIEHSTVDNIDNDDKTLIEKKEDLVVEKKRTQQIKHHSRSNMMTVEDTSEQNGVKKRVVKRRSHSNIVATGNLIDNVVDNAQVLKSYDLRHRVQPMAAPLHPTPSTSILLSSDEEAEILSRHPVRKGRSPHRKIGIAPDSAEDNERPYTVVKSVAKYKVSLQKGNLLVKKLDKEAEKPTEATTFKEDEEVKAVEPIVSDVEEEETITPPQVVVSTATTPPDPPKWMHLNSAEFLFALLLTALLFITYWCWNSDVC